MKSWPLGSRMLQQMKVRRWVVTLALALPCAALAAPENITRGEMARLPEYCPDSQTFDKVGFPENPTPRQRRWVAMMGKPFWAIHHYCWALVAANRAAVAGVTKQERDYLLKSAISDIYFVFNQSGPDFVLLPELYFRVGEYYTRLDKPVEADSYFERSIASKRDYWPAYIGQAKLQGRLGRPENAVSILRQGLELMPDQPQLMQALAEHTSQAKVPMDKKPAR